MLSGKTVSVDMIIEQLQQDYGFENLNKPEIVEWVWRSMGIIGTPYPYADKLVEMDIVDYKSKLPVNLYSITMIREKTTGITLREMTDLFNTFGDSVYEGTTEIIADYDPTLDPRDSDSYFETIVGPDSSSEYYTFKVQEDYIYCGLQYGTVEMQYKAIPIDIITGIPTIPDDIKYIRGIVSFIAERLAFRMMLKDQLTERKYDLIRTDYLFNIGAAQSACYALSPARMETLINRWKSTYLGPEHFDTGFKYLGSRE